MVPAKLQETPSTTLATAPMGGFGKVLNSLQGLQQRLDDFSVEEVIRASTTAESLIEQLSLLQVKLAGAGALKKALIDAHQLAGQIPAEDSASIKLSSLEEYPTLKALLITSNQLRQAVLECPVITPKSKSPEKLALPRSVSEVEFSPIDASSGAVSIAQTARQSGSDRKATAAGSKPTPPPKSKPVATPKQSSARNQSDFDQRLLDDLIKTYGDFVTTPNLPAPVRASEPTPSAKTKTDRVNPPAPTIAPTEINADYAKASEGLTPKAETARSNPAEIVPILQTEPVKGDSTKSLTRQVEIDRQLKSIIKDYGEYDLYPRDNPLNVKVAGVVAFALLGLVLALFYLFKTPTPITTAPGNSVPGSLNPSSGKVTNYEKEKK